MVCFLVQEDMPQLLLLAVQVQYCFTIIIFVGFCTAQIKTVPAAS